MLIHDTRNKDYESTIIAKEGKISNLSEKPHIIVFDGSRFLFSKDNFKNSIMNFDKYEFQINIEKPDKGARFKQVEERSFNELFFENNITNKKLLNEFLAEGHRRITSPFLSLFMSLVAACSILYGVTKHSNYTRRIAIVSGIVVTIQAIYVVLINSINFSITNIMLLYITLFVMIVFPLILIEYEKNIFKSLFFFKK